MIDISSLPWLPEAPASFRAECRALAGAQANLAAKLCQLAGYRLDGDQLLALESAARRCTRAEDGVLPAFEVALVSNATSALLSRAIRATGLRYGLDIRMREPDYGQVFQSVLDERSALYRPGLNAVLFALDHRAFDLRQDLSEETAKEMAERAFEQLMTLARAVHRFTDATVLVQTLAPPPVVIFGNLDCALPGAALYAIDRFNALLRAHVRASSDVLIDVAALAATVGTLRWHDAVMWHTAKLPFAPEFIPLYADHVGRLLNALRGRSRKCLVLDLDNTIWGGAIGDDGLEGIVVGQGSPAGEAFLEVQRLALDLRERGIVLAACSKNEEETARLPFRKHPDMLLREEHLAAFIANWEDKARNLETIAKTLNIGTDALVLLDDNPFERANVRARLPMVAVPELTADPAHYPTILSAAGYFEATAFVAEDRVRAAFYEANTKRALALEGRSIEDYLASLEMELSLKPFDATGRARIAQLINKTNQFNLTTRRYTEDQVREMEEDPRLFTLQARLKDSFGDSGMISVVIARKEDERWSIDTWLMSCRVLGRHIEEAVLNRLAEAARGDGAKFLLGTYIPTAKNALVEHHYERLGFALTGKSEDGRSEWLLPLGDYAAKAVPITCVN